MRKLIAIVLCTISVISLVGCKSTNITEETSKNKIIRESDTDVQEDVTIVEESTSVETTEETIDESNDNYIPSGYKSGNYLLADWRIDPVTIANTRKILINVEELVIDANGDVAGAVVYVGNDSNEDITINIKEFYINNLLWFWNNDDFITVNSGEDGYAVLGFDMHELALYTINDIGVISIALECVNSNGAKMFETKLEDIRTTYDAELEEPSMISGEIVGDTDNILVSAKCYKIENQHCISLFVTNRTEEEMHFDLENVTINNIDYGKIINFSIPAGKSQHISFDLMTHYKINNDCSSTGISKISFIAGYKLGKSVAYDWKSDNITLDFN